MQKNTFKNIKPSFFQFQGILDIHRLNKRWFWSEGIAYKYLTQKLAKISPDSILMPIAKRALYFKYKWTAYYQEPLAITISVVVRP